MASKQEVERLGNEKRDLGRRLSELEVDLSRKEESLRAANQRYSCFAASHQHINLCTFNVL